ncbi:MAG: RNA recognition motif domain-containing protein [Bacteroidales bacterium]
MNLYVGNISDMVNESELKKIFEKFGQVKSVKLITDKDTGTSKGYGFVEMENKEDGKKALEKANGMEINGQRLKVNIVRPKNPRYRKY